MAQRQIFMAQTALVHHLLSEIRNPHLYTRICSLAEIHTELVREVVQYRTEEPRKRGRRAIEELMSSSQHTLIGTGVPSSTSARDWIRETQVN